jgi:serine/threonine protein kinase
MCPAAERSACPDDEAIVLFMAGALDAREEARIRAHVNGCDACRTLLAEAARSDVPATRHKPAAVREPSGSRSPLAGKYVLEEELGSGGMGRVFRGRHVGLDRPVAIKLLHVELLSDPVVIKRFEREARAAAALKSRHVVQILDIDYLPSGAPFIVMEYLEGCDLSQLLERQPTAMALADAVRYVLEACDAIAEAHARGIVHRDLKPQNLFLTNVEGADPIVKILDFGLAKRLSIAGRADDSSNDSVTGVGGLIGTPHFMSPEQIRARADIDHRTDIWSIGATLYQLVTGRPPYLATNFHMLAARMLKEEASPMQRLRADVPPILDEIVLRCLCKAPDDRFQSIDQFATSLRAIMPQLLVAETPITERTGPNPALDPALDLHGMETIDLTRELSPDTDRTLIDAPSHSAARHSGPSHSASSHSAPSQSAPVSSEDAPETIPIPAGLPRSPRTPRRD